MSASTSSPAGGSASSSKPTSTNPTPAGSPKKVIHQGVSAIRPPLIRNDSSFTTTVTKAIKSQDDNLDLAEVLSNTTLDALTKETIKEDINLVKAVTSDVAPLRFPEPEGWNVLVQPAPKTKAHFLGDITRELRKIGHLKNGLNTYIRVIHSEKHHVFSKKFLDGEIETTDKMQLELDDLKVQIEAIQAQVKQIITPAGTPRVNESNQQEINDYFTATWDDKVDTQIVDKYDKVKPLVHKIRAFFISAHVWYKINYALCPDREKVGEGKSEEVEGEGKEEEK